MKKLKLRMVIAGVLVTSFILTANSQGISAKENDISQENFVESNQTTGATVSTQTTGAAVSNDTAVTTLEVSTNEKDYDFDSDTGTINKYTGSDTEVIIPSEINGVKVKCIGDESFNYLYNLTSVSIPEGVTDIGNFAFSDCSSINSIEIPDSVTSIGEGAFGNCQSMKSINIPDSVTSIGNLAFNNCQSMESIKLPNQLTSINDQVFLYCKNLTSVEIPDSVTIIGLSAFSGCESLTGITIPKNVVSIENGAFGMCYKLKNITAADDNESYASVDGILLDKSKTQIIKYPSGKEDKSYIIPENITDIGNSAFDRCSNLESIEMPDSVTYVGEGAFGSCTNLTSIKLSNNLTTISYGAFWYCTNLNRIIIPNGVTSISDAFSNCDSLTSITIPASVSIDGGWGVNFITCLKENEATIYIDSEVQKEYLIEEGVMKSKIILNGSPIDESGESDYEIDAHTGTIIKYKGSIYDKDIVIPNTINGVKVKAIKDTVFSDKEYYINSITIPDGVTSIKSNTFKGCRSVTRINLPNSIKSIGDGAFINFCLINMTIPKDLKSINNQTFKDCTNMMSVIIPDGVASIGDEAFENCSSLKELKIPSSVKKIGKETFADCTNLKSVTVPDSVTKIGKGTFYQCDNATFYVNSKKSKERLIYAGVNKNKIIIKVKRK